MIELDSSNTATYFHEVWWKGCSFGLHSSTRSVCSLLEGDLEMTTDDHSDGVGAVDASTDSAAGEDPSLKVLTGGDQHQRKSVACGERGDTVGGHSNDLHQVGADATAWRL